MSGSAVQNFAATYGSYANTAGSELGVSPDIILSQWGLETGWGSNLEGTNNLGGLQNGNTPINFSSIGDFVIAFVANIKSNWSGAVNSGVQTSTYVSGLDVGQSGGYSTNTNYLSSLEGAESALQTNATGIFNALLTPASSSSAISVGGGTSTSGNTVAASTTQAGSASGSATGTCSGISAVFDFSCWASLLPDLVLIIVGVLLLYGAISSSIKYSKVGA